MFDDWFSYSLVDFIPVEMDVYIGLFSRANNGLWPWTLIPVILGIVLVVLVKKQHVKYACWLLGLAWFFCAYQFHFKLLSELNWVGSYFAGVFFLQGFLLLVISFLTPSSMDASQFQARLGLSILLLAMIIFLIIPLFTDRPWSSVEVFSIAPNPTCLMTLGAMLALNIRRWWLYLIPVAWSLFSVIVAFAMNAV